MKMNFPVFSKGETAMDKKPLKDWGFRLVILLAFGLLLSMSKIQGQYQPPVDGPPPLPKPVDLKSAPVTVYSMVENHPYVTWNTLAHYEYDAPEIEEEIDPQIRLKKKKKYPIPDFVKKLDGTSIAAVGFMIPLDTDDADQKATSFILARTTASCCYGIVPKMNEWMFVQMKKGKTAEVMMDIPITVFGTLSVGEEKKEDTGWSLYRMVSDKVVIPSAGW